MIRKWLEAGVIEVLKISHEELLEGGHASGESRAAVLAGIQALRERGAEHVVVSRGPDTTLASIGGDLVEVVTDYLEGSLPAEQRLLFEEHLAFCDWCQSYLQQMRETIRLTGTLREGDLTPEARDGLLGVFRDWRRR